MIDPSELLFVVDENNKPLDPLPRDFVQENKIWHRCSHIWIINKNNQILCQKRSALKDKNPGKWEAHFGGHMGPGESYEENAQKELNEELGIKCTTDELHFFEIYKNAHAYEFQAIYYLLWDGDLASLQLEQAEVSEVVWKSIEELEQYYVTKDENWVQTMYTLTLLNHVKTIK